MSTAKTLKQMERRGTTVKYALHGRVAFPRTIEGLFVGHQMMGMLPSIATALSSPNCKANSINISLVGLL